ncbi:MAG: glycosyltransferase family 4 protein [Dehalococcoidales bacterium]|jgi:glycosyltransferase involved in cell wall biosynthesis
MNTINVMHLRSGVRGSKVILGAEGVILQIVKNIDRSRFQPVVVSFKDPYIDTIPLIKEAGLLGIPTELIDPFGRFDVVTSAFRLRKLFKKYNTHILHCHEYKSDIIGYLATRKTNVHLISTQHLWAGEVLRARIYEYLDSIVIKSNSFERIIAVSEDIKSTLISRNIKEKRIVVIPNGIDVDKYDIDVNEKTVKDKLGITDDKIVICCIGRLSPQKGHFYLLNAAKEVIKAYRNVIFLLVGDGPLKKDLENLSSELGIKNNIIFTGYRDDVKDILGISRLFVMPSSSEGTPMALLEAMASGRAVIATNVGGIPEVIKDGFNGILIKPKDAKGMAEAIIRLLGNKVMMGDYGNNAKACIKSNYSSEVMTEKYENLYKELLNG